MEKQAVVKPGLTPSIVSGKPSDFIKSSNAFCKGEKDKITHEENRLAKQMTALYNNGNDAAAN